MSGVGATPGSSVQALDRTRRSLRIAVIANSDWYLWNFRVNLMRRIADEGHEVLAVSPDGKHGAMLKTLGIRHAAWALDPSGTQPLREFRSLASLRRILQRESIDVALTYTPKVNIYAGLATRGLRTIFAPNVSGLGSGFLRQSWLTGVMRVLYRLAFRRAACVFFQNGDDRDLFVQRKLVAERHCVSVPGSGVDLNRFKPAPLPCGRPRQLLFVGRTLGDKGLFELAEAMRLLSHRRDDLCLLLLGPTDAKNPSAIGADVLAGWAKEGLLEHIDGVDDVEPYIARADGVVLPSYREGVPRSLLEAAAMGRPCIATDVPGCRDVVAPGSTGWLCQPKDPASLAAAILRFLDADDAQLRVMGAAARAKVEREFAESRVLDAYSDFLESLQR